jgi:hypothetical protein
MATYGPFPSPRLGYLDTSRPQFAVDCNGMGFTAN